MKEEIKELIKKTKEIEDNYRNHVNSFLKKTGKYNADQDRYYFAEGIHMEKFRNFQYEKLYLSVIEICDKAHEYIKELCDKNQIRTDIVINYRNIKKACSNLLNDPRFNMVSELENNVQKGRAEMCEWNAPGILDEIRTLSAEISAGDTQDHISSIIDIIKMPGSDKWIQITMPIISILYIEYVKVIDYQRLIKFQKKTNLTEEEAIPIIHYLISKNLTSFYFKMGKYPENTLLVKKVMDKFSKEHSIRPEDCLEVFQEYIGDGKESNILMNHEIINDSD
jgi:hypothetical protein